MSVQVFKHADGAFEEVTTAFHAFETDETYVLFKKDPPQQVFVLNSDDDTRSAALEQANKLIEHCEGNVSIIEEFQEKGYSEAFTKLIFDSLSINGDPSEEDADAGTEDAATTGGASAASKKKKKKKKNNKNNSAAVAAPVVEDAPTAVETEEAVEEQTIEEEKPAVEEATEDKKEEAALVEEKKEDIPAQNDPEPAAIEQETKIEEIRPVSQPEKKENLSHKGSEPEEQVQPPPITTPTPAPETTKATPTKKQAPLTSAAAVASTPSRTNAPTTSTLSPVSTKSYLADSAKAWGGSGSHASTQSSAAVLPDQKTFSYAELKVFTSVVLFAEMRVESGIDMTKKEAYLSDDEFKKVFGKDRAAYTAQPAWRQQLQKKEVGLW